MLVVVTFDLCYCYVLPEWERFVHDSRVLIDVVVNHGFSIPKEKYYLTNAGYCNFDYTIILYQGIQYHL